MTTIERRFAPLSDVEIRDGDDDIIKFRGHAAVFDSMTEIAGFRERVAPGAFKRTIGPGRADVRFLFNHDPDTVMARSTNDTLRLSEDQVGLKVDADLDPGDWDVQRLAPKLRSANVDQMSFAFRTVKHSWDDEPEDGGPPIRTLEEVQLFDVSPVTYPAYPDTDAAIRSAASSAYEVAKDHGIDGSGCERCAVRAYRESFDLDTETTSSEFDEDQQISTDDAAQDDPAPATEPGPSSSQRELRKKRIEYLESTLR